MRNFVFHPRWLAAIFVGALSVISPLAAQIARPELASKVRPTVTAADGDRGGRFFGKTPDPARTHHYYVAAEADGWAYAPSGRDEVCGLPLPPPVLAAPRNDKVRYIQYTDATFRSRVFSTPSLGLLGP